MLPAIKASKVKARRLVASPSPRTKARTSWDRLPVIWVDGVATSHSVVTLTAPARLLSKPIQMASRIPSWCFIDLLLSSPIPIHSITKT